MASSNTQKHDDHTSFNVSYDREDLVVALPNYKSNSIFFISAEIHDLELEAEAVPFHLDCYTIQPNHLTREHVISFVTQAAYLLCSQSSDILGISSDQFWEANSRDEALITSLQMKFARKLENARVGFKLSVRKKRILSNRVYLELNFSIGNSDCHGTCSAIIKIQQE